jgi:hypothetical protein
MLPRASNGDAASVAGRAVPGGNAPVRGERSVEQAPGPRSRYRLVARAGAGSGGQIAAMLDEPDLMARL